MIVLYKSCSPSPQTFVTGGPCQLWCLFVCFYPPNLPPPQHTQQLLPVKGRMTEGLARIALNMQDIQADSPYQQLHFRFHRLERAGGRHQFLQVQEVTWLLRYKQLDA